ncbi:GntR family transcriptional regulator, partial [Nocardioides sp.]|uniref:GntR family transcriptional regulator n=1 Tax=Nocardioides sp. TaxID=35761 RepID=UPI002EDBB312
MTTLPVRLDRDAPGPLGVQLSGRIRELVLAGTLTRGDRLPSTRALAADLGVSRAVTEQAYEQLLAEGWLTARRGSGTYVAADGPARPGVPSPRAVRPAEHLVRLDA